MMYKRMNKYRDISKYIIIYLPLGHISNSLPLALEYK